MVKDSQTFAETTEELGERYLHALASALATDQEAIQLWSGNDRWLSPRWTTAMTIALAKAAHHIFDKCHIAGKGVVDHKYADPYRRREYLTLDLTAYDNSGWAAPKLIVEHENSPDSYKLQYCAWKLLSVYADFRVLVAYYASEEKKYPHFKNSINELAAIFDDVLKDHQTEPPKRLILLAGDWSAQWGQIFSCRVLSSKP